MAWQHCQIVNINQRPGRKGRKTQKTYRDANRIAALICKKDNSGGMLAQTGDKFSPHILRQRLAIAHRILGISINQFDNRPLMFDPIEIGLQYLNRRFSL